MLNFRAETHCSASNLLLKYCLYHPVSQAVLTVTCYGPRTVHTGCTKWSHSAIVVLK